MAVTLLPHNKKTYKKIQELFKTKKRVGIVQPTGTGKSFLYLKWLEDHPHDSFAILAPSLEIFTQLREYAIESKAPGLLDQVQMISYQALSRMREDEIDSIRADKIILDEFHRTGAELWGPVLQRLLDANPNAFVLGASATPIRYLDRGRDMADELFYRNLASEMTLGEAVIRKILPTPRYIPVWYDAENLENTDKQEDSAVTQKASSRDKNRKFNQLKNTLEMAYGAEKVFKKYFPKNGKFIVFCRNEQHLKKMMPTVSEWLRDINSNIRFYISVSSATDRDQQVMLFKNDITDNAIRMLFTIDRLNEGVHIKSINGVIMLRPTNSPTVYLQQIGRAIAVGNKKPLIFDMVNNYQNLQYLDDIDYVNVFEKELLDAAEPNDPMAFEILADMKQFSALINELEAQLYMMFDAFWEEWFKLYKDYKLEFGEEPGRRQQYRNWNLGGWCNTQRQFYKNGTLTEERINKLTEAGFVFTVRERSWQESKENYILYKSVYGKDPVKNEWFNGENLGNWVSTQRENFKKGKLLPERIKQLLDIDFIFSPLDHAWEKHLANCIAYTRQTGLEPGFDTVFNDDYIGHWCNRQRRAYNNKTLAPEREQLLIAAGFIFDTREAEWMAAFNKFSKEQTDKKEKQKQSVWLTAQRTNYKKGKLSQKHLELLTAAGFDIDPLETKWRKMLALYIAFKAASGKEPVNSDVFRGEQLGRWCARQRKAYMKGALPEHHEKLLREAGFPFPERGDAAYDLL